MKNTLCYDRSLSSPEDELLVMKRKLSNATTKSTLFTISKDEWKEGTGKLMKNELYVLQYVKRHLSGRSDVEQ